MWKATIKNKQINSAGTFLITVNYSDGERSFDEVHGTRDEIDTTWVENTIKRKLESLENISSMDNSVVMGEFTPTQTIETKEAPTAKEIFLNKVQKLRMFKTLIELGVLNENNTDFIELQTELKNKFDSSLIN